MVYKHPITIRKWEEDDQEWRIFYTCHARINHSSSVKKHESGVVSGSNTTDFDVRYCKLIAKLEFETQLYRIDYKDAVYDLAEYDDFMENHQTVRLKGVGKRVR